MNITHLKGTVVELEHRSFTIFLRTEGIHLSPSWV